MRRCTKAVLAALVLSTVTGCGKSEPATKADGTSTSVSSTSASVASSSRSRTDSPVSPAAASTATPVVPPTNPVTGSPALPAQESSEPASPGVPAGRLGANFVAVFEAEGARQLGLFSKKTGNLVNDLGATVGPDDAQPQASADGKHVYFVHSSGAACDSGLYRVPVAGGGAERLIDPKEQVEAFALDQAGTAIQAVRVAGCGTGQSKRVLSEYDAASGALVADRDLRLSPATVITRLGWHAESGLIAAAQTGKGAVDTVETFELRESDTTEPYLVGLPACLGRIRSVRFSTDALYIARDCLNPETAVKAGHIYRNELGMEQLQTVHMSASGTTVAGLHVDEFGGFAFSTVRWLEEDDEGPTTVFSVDREESPKRLFETERKLTELVW